MAAQTDSIPTGSNIRESLRSGDWLDRRRLHLGAAVLLAIEIAVFLFMVAGTHGWIVPLPSPTTTDFVSFYAAGKLANAGAPELAYNLAAHLAAEEAVTAPGIQYQFFNYPPVFLMICAALARLPYLAGFILFAALTLVFYVLVTRRIVGDSSATTVLVLLAFPAVFWNIGLGQNAFLTAGLFGGATLLIDRRPVMAGILFGALCYKPHFGLLVPLALTAGGHWRAFLAAAASATALVVASLALFGWTTWHDFLAIATGSRTMYESGRILFGGMISPFGAARLLGAGTGLSYAVQAAATVIAAAIVFVVWRRHLSLPVRAAILIAATLVALPLSLIYDMMLAVVAGAWLVRGSGEDGLPALEKNLFAVFFLVLLDARNLAEMWHLPVLTLAAATLLAIVVRRALPELRQTGRSAWPAAANPAG